MFKQRKGVSEVVANVLIVLLVIVGIAVIWSVVKPTIDKSAEGIQSDCFTVQLEPISCDISDSTVKVKRNPGAGSFEKIEIVFEQANGNSAKVATTNSPAVTSSNLAELSTVGLTFNAATSGAVVGTKANIAITSGGQLCQVTTAAVDCVA